jgi:Flp pilus assembly CpaF family ATPase
VFIERRGVLKSDVRFDDENRLLETIGAWWRRQADATSWRLNPMVDARLPDGAARTPSSAGLDPTLR